LTITGRAVRAGYVARPVTNGGVSPTGSRELGLGVGFDHHGESCEGRLVCSPLTPPALCLVHAPGGVAALSFGDVTPSSVFSDAASTPEGFVTPSPGRVGAGVTPAPFPPAKQPAAAARCGTCAAPPTLDESTR
jgi:hypothetical protein